MNNTVRFGVSLDLELLDRFDALIKGLGFASRSEAVRHLIRAKLVEQEWDDPDRGTLAAAFLVYGHDETTLAARLSDVQHDSFAHIVSSLHVHIDKENCLEVIVMKGKGRDLRDLGEKMISLKGVKYGTLALGTSGQQVP